MILFGSRAEAFRTGSDIDLALVGEDINHEELLRIYNDIDDLGLLYKVDLLHYEEKRGTPIGENISTGLEGVLPAEASLFVRSR